jgi:alpha-amylase
VRSEWLTSGQFSVFDAPLHYNFKEAADRGADYDLRAIWDNTVVKNRPVDAVGELRLRDSR